MSSYSSTYPSVSPTYQIDFSNGKRIPPNATFSRADTASSGSWSPFTNTPTLSNSTPGTTNQYYLISINSTADLGAGVQSWTAGKYIQWTGSVWAQVDQPIGVTYWSNEKHLSSENLITDSNAFTGTATVRVVNTSGQADPAGGTDAVQLSQQSGQTAAGAVYWTYTALRVGQEYTWSVYVKNNGRTAPQLADDFGTASARRDTWFDTSSSGAVGTSDAGHTALITKLGDWFRITVRFTAQVATGNIYFYISSTDNSSTVPDDGAGFYAYGASLSTTGQLVHENTSGQIHRSYAPSLKYVTPATGGMARFEYDPADGQSMGLLVEGSSTNLISYSSDSTQWAKAFSSATGSAAVAPDGSLSATAWVPDTSLNSHYTHPSSLPTVASGTTYTGSVYVKSAGLTLCQLTWSSSGFGAGYKVNFNLSGSGSVVGTAGGASGTISQCGNGWFRLTITAAATSSGSGVMVIGAIDSESSGRLPSYSGDGYNGLLIWQLQQETGSFPSSAISTSGSAVTRAADSLSADLTEVGYTGGPFTVVSETSDGLGSYPRAFTLTDGSLSNRLTVHRTSGAATTSTDWLFAGIVDGSSNVSETIPSSASAGKLAVSYDTNDVSVCASGGTVATDSSAVFPDGLTTMNIGANYAGGQQLNGHVKRVALYNEALSDTNLQALTS